LKFLVRARALHPILGGKGAFRAGGLPEISRFAQG
jgi:hypothetical protein